MAKTKKTYTTRPIDRLAATVIVWLWINCAADLFDVALAGVDLFLLGRSPWGAALGSNGEIPGDGGLSLYTSTLRLPVVVVALIAGFLALKWMYRASRNTHALHPGLPMSPPWTVGWFFIPVAFLWKPFDGMSQTWRVTFSPEGWKAVEPPSLLRVWWGFWLAATLMGNASGRVTLFAADTGTLSVGTGLEAASSLASVVANVCLVLIVRRVSARQTERISEATAAPTPTPGETSGPWGAVPARPSDPV